MTVTWFDGIQIQVLAGFSSAEGDYGIWGTGLWGTATWGPSTVFTDISAWTMGFSTDRAFSRELSEWDTGTATVTLNNLDGRFSPSNPTSPYVVGGVTGVRPWIPIVVNVEGVPVFTGYALDWQETYEQGSPGGGGAYVAVRCVDELGSLSRFDALETVAQGGTEPPGDRIHRILDNAGHTGLRAVDVGRVTLQATTHDNAAVSELKLVADSEGGALYVDRDGAVTFEDRYYLVEHDRSNTVQATFGDGGYQSVLSLTGGSVSAPDTPAFAIAGDIDVRVHVALDDWTPGGFGVFLISQWPNTAGNNAWNFAVTATGLLQFSWTPDGTTASQIVRQSTELPTLLDGTHHWLRATLDADNGAVGHDVRFYTSEDGDNWTQLGGVVTGAGTTSIFNSTADLSLSAVLPFNGKVRQAEVRDAAGTVVANPDFALQIDGATSLRDTAGNTWTLTGNAAIVDDLTVDPELPYSDIALSYSGDQIVNIVALSREQTDDEQEADITPPVATTQDETSRALYGDSRYVRTDLVNDTDADLDGIAELYLAAHKDAELRVEQITFKPRSRQYDAQALLIDQAVNRRIRDKIRVIRRPPGGDTIVRNCHIAGIHHSLTRGDEWDVTFDLWSATVYETFESFLWDNANWDEGQWFF